MTLLGAASSSTSKAKDRWRRARLLGVILTRLQKSVPLQEPAEASAGHREYLQKLRLGMRQMSLGAATFASFMDKSRVDACAAEASRAVADGSVLVEAGTEAEVSGAEWWRQGDQEMYTRDNLKRRVALRRDASIVEALEAFWDAALKSVQSGGDSTAHALHHAGYFDLMDRVYRSLLPSYDADDAAKSIDEDWERDTRGALELVRAPFLDALFELVDTWSEGIHAATYVEFLSVLFGHISTWHETTDQHTGEKVGAYYIWKDKETVTYDSDKFGNPDEGGDGDISDGGDGGDDDDDTGDHGSGGRGGGGGDHGTSGGGGRGDGGDGGSSASDQRGKPSGSAPAADASIIGRKKAKKRRSKEKQHAAVQMQNVARGKLARKQTSKRRHAVELIQGRARRKVKMSASRAADKVLQEAARPPAEEEEDKAPGTRGLKQKWALRHGPSGRDLIDLHVAVACLLAPSRARPVSPPRARADAPLTTPFTRLSPPSSGQSITPSLNSPPRAVPSPLRYGRDIPQHHPGLTGPSWGFGGMAVDEHARASHATLAPSRSAPALGGRVPKGGIHGAHPISISDGAGLTAAAEGRLSPRPTSPGHSSALDGRYTGIVKGELSAPGGDGDGMTSIYVEALPPWGPPVVLTSLKSAHGSSLKSGVGLPIARPWTASSSMASLRSTRRPPTATSTRSELDLPHAYTPPPTPFSVSVCVSRPSSSGVRSSTPAIDDTRSRLSTPTGIRASAVSRHRPSTATSALAGSATGEPLDPRAVYEDQRWGSRVLASASSVSSPRSKASTWSRPKHSMRPASSPPSPPPQLTPWGAPWSAEETPRETAAGRPMDQGRPLERAHLPPRRPQSGAARQFFDPVIGIYPPLQPKVPAGRKARLQTDPVFKTSPRHDDTQSASAPPIASQSSPYGGPPHRTWAGMKAPAVTKTPPTPPRWYPKRVACMAAAERCERLSAGVVSVL